MKNQETTQQNQIKLDYNPAVAAVAWRNNGDKAPISVRFIQNKKRQGGSFHENAIARSLGIKQEIQQSCLMHYTESAFTECYGEFGFTAEDITNSYRDEDGEISAHELNIPSEDLFDEPYYISRYETTEEAECFDVNGNLQQGWSIKKVNDRVFTNDGKVIYATNIFTQDGVDYKLANDQTSKIDSNITITSKSVKKIIDNIEESNYVEANNLESKAPF